MNRTKIRFLVPFAAMLALPVYGQDVQTCDTIEFEPVLTERYPEISEACIDVVVKDGKQFAKLRVEVVKPRLNGVTFRFVHADGEYGPTQSVSLDPSWRAKIGGKEYRSVDLLPGQQLSLYMPPDSWVGHMEREAGVTVVNYDFLTLEDVSDAAEIED